MSMLGKTLGHYQISNLIGKGGMGEVYQAKDQKLGRDVAIKVLPEEFAKDADRVARFQREAKLLASLNHPNIAAIHGLEESGGTNFLVLELVEGDTLADRIKTGPIPVEESLKLALQIAEALEAAHEKGVIHRDLKPANIKVTPDGKVKVLDFGLAKAFAGEQEVNLSNSPTLSDAATQQGVILGTAAYMSPEQARGKAVDKRADIWAFGVVLFEMLTGRQVFTGETVSDTLASVLAREPDWNRLPPNLHPRIRFLLERCLKKEPKNRYSGISDARVDIQEVFADPSGLLTQQGNLIQPQRKLRTILPWVAVTAILCFVIAAWSVWLMKPEERREVTRLYYELPEGQRFTTLDTPDLAVSPNGRYLVYGTPEGLYLRSLDELNAKHIAGTAGRTELPFFSPNGEWIGYWTFTDRQLKKIPINGGVPVTLCTDVYPTGVWWHTDDTIVFSQAYDDIMRVSANGGTPESLVKAESRTFTSPQILPDGKWLLYTDIVRTNQWRILLQSLESGKTETLFEGGDAHYLSTGHIVYRLPGNDNIIAVRFDPNSLKVAGGHVPIVEGVIQAAVSDTGTLVYVPGRASVATQPRRTLVWVDRDGNEEVLGTPPDLYRSPNISPDGNKIAVSNGSENILIWDLKRRSSGKLTFDGSKATPVWTPDGKRIVFSSMRNESEKKPLGIYWKNSNGTGEEELLASIPSGYIFPYCWSSDPNILIGTEALDSRNFDIWTLSMDGEGVRRPLLQGAGLETQPRISPDGHYVAYVSNETGQGGIFVRPFPQVNEGKWQVTENGGDTPLWSPDGRELFYMRGDTVMSVAVIYKPTFGILGTPKELFRGPYACPAKDIGDSIPWDISSDGKRFLMIKEPEPTTFEDKGPRKINIVLNWFEELKERVPVK